MTPPQPHEATPGRAARMRAILTSAFSPIRLEIEDDSAKHAGHAGAAAGGETHFTVTIVSDVFMRRSRVERSRMVHDALASEFDLGLHALSLHFRSPGE